MQAYRNLTFDAPILVDWKMRKRAVEWFESTGVPGYAMAAASLEVVNSAGREA